MACEHNSNVAILGASEAGIPRRRDSRVPLIGVRDRVRVRVRVSVRVRVRV